MWRAATKGSNKIFQKNDQFFRKMLPLIPWWFLLTAQLGNPGPTGSGAVEWLNIKNAWHHSLPIKLAKATSFCVASYKGEIEAIK